ncbi:putative premnaspirodiene oxygenase-like [Capsicum annuum]|nr:putative premnaspirodiene oxygenase-like [Capsicum annuum]
MKADGTIDKYKARLVVKGFKQKEGLDYFNTYLPVTRITSIRMLISLAAVYGLEIHQMDVKIAFLNGELEEEIYMEQLKGFVVPEKKNKVCRLIKSLYGLKQAPKQWHAKFDQTIRDISDINTTKGILESKFDMKDLGVADVILGIRIHQTPQGLALSQSHYIEKVLDKFKYMEFGIAKTPLDASFALRKNEGYSDANWITGSNEVKSTSQYVFTISGGAVSSKSSKQTCIARSTMEFEFIALDKAGEEAEWLRNFSKDIPYWSKPVALVCIHCDSQAAIGFRQCWSEFGKVFKEQDELILLVKKLSRLMEGFDVTDIFPSLKLLHVLCGMKGRIMDVHHELDAIFENIINENKNNGELEGEGFVAALDIFSAGTETSSATIDWIMVEMMRNPNMLSKAQTEVRNTFRGKESFDENDVEEFKYLKLVIKESFRLHPPFPLLLPRECREETDINGYTIPRKTKVMVNAWAIGRDSKYWNDAESFKHERFEHNSMDFIDNNFEYLPFGSGRRMCPGISFGLANICFPLTQLLYHFDWKLPNRISPNNLDLTESIGASCARKNNLYLIMVPYQPCQE